MIELRDITKTFTVAERGRGALGSLFRRRRTARALDGVSFRVGRGEIIGLIGPNGAGKSTTVKIMSGILTPDSGFCEILGVCPWKRRQWYVGRIGVVFGQRTQLWWDVPVRDSLRLLGDIYRVDPARLRANVAALSEILDLGALLDTPLRQLSLGQRTRCELAASLIHDPEILFLDEPTIGLDVVSKLAVRRVVAQLNRERGVTVILTSHDMDDIEALTSRLMLIARGRILYDGPLARLREEYDRTRRVELTLDCAGATGAAGAAGAVGDAVTVDAALPEFPGVRVVERPEAARVIYEVDTSVIAVSAAIRQLCDRLPARDLTATARPVESLIASVYESIGLAGGVTADAGTAAS